MTFSKQVRVRDGGFCRIVGLQRIVATQNTLHAVCTDEAKNPIFDKSKSIMRKWGVSSEVISYNYETHNLPSVAKIANGVVYMMNNSVFFLTEPTGISTKQNVHKLSSENVGLLELKLEDIFGLNDSLGLTAALQEGNRQLEGEVNSFTNLPNHNSVLPNSDILTYTRFVEMAQKQREKLVNSPAFISSDGTYAYLASLGGLLIPLHPDRAIVGGYDYNPDQIDAHLHSSKLMLLSNRDSANLIAFRKGEPVLQVPYAVTDEYFSSDLDDTDDVEDAALANYGVNLYGDWQLDERKKDIDDYGSANQPCIQETFLCGRYLVSVDITGRLYSQYVGKNQPYTDSPFEISKQSQSEFDSMEYSPNESIITATHGNLAVAYWHNRMHIFKNGKLCGIADKQDLNPSDMTMCENIIYVVDEDSVLRRYVIENV
jgi:hypothetical protein